jgi:YjbE family integral membrane protein
MLESTISELTRAHLWGTLPQIVFVNILLSGDNAVVIAMACRALPRRQRMWGLIIGEAFAVILLIVFAAIMVRLLQLPYLKIAGGIALLYIAARLSVPEDDGAEIEAATRLWRAVRIVVVADLVMSFDNVLAIVQIANGDLALLGIGLAVSIPIVVGGAALLTGLLDRWRVLVWAGTILLGWVAGQTIIDDRAISPYIRGGAAGRLPGGIDVAAGCAGALLALFLGALWRHRRVSKSHTTAPRGG